ncbi:hypothetical protein B296_00003371 [Ensete ventricosum]|uniref:Uncharacterized protein n=1 Tax=Ensete ventricosum TaxID=4639 RepID=A0A427BC52_ENSVE|nr:hypothetical protein B296_00003371 [Ensete ventricosum]
MELKWRSGRLWPAVLVALAAAAVVVTADRGLRPEKAGAEVVEAEEVGLSDYVLKVVDFLWRPDGSSYRHVWPVKMGFLLFFWSPFRMIMGAAGSTVWYNLKLRHPTLDMPIIDYDLALLFQPMLMLGISIGVAFNVIFADWMVTVLLIVLFLSNYISSFPLSLLLCLLQECLVFRFVAYC